MFYLEDVSCVVTFTLTVFSRILNRLAYAIFLTISFLRFLSIKNPFLRLQNRTLNRIMLTQLILTTGLSTILYMLQVDNLVIGEFAIFLLVCLLVIMGTNIMSYKQLRIGRKSKKCCVRRNGHTQNDSIDVRTSITAENGKRKGEAVVTLMIITTSYLVTNLPFLLFILLGVVQSLKGSLQLVVVQTNPVHLICLLYYPLLVNSGINATIYILRTKEIKNIVYKLLLVH